VSKNAEIDLQSVAGSGKHWGIYHDAVNNELKFWQGNDQVIFSGAGKVTASDFCLKSGICLSNVLVSNFAGLTTSTYDGSQNGYYDANTKCSTAFSGSHICTAEEILSIINSRSITASMTGYAWISNGSPGSTAVLGNDCEGWTSNSSDFIAVFWHFLPAGGTTGLTSCNSVIPFSCCR
jgi:hypothetical protein